MSKYARIEYERRFLLKENLSHLPLLDVKSIEDHYLLQVGLRLRKMSKADSFTYKLTQKKPITEGNLSLHEITTIYLTAEYYQHLRESLASFRLHKTRNYFQLGQHKVGVDEVIIGSEKLLIMEVEFGSLQEMQDFPIYGREVTHDLAYSGFALAQQQQKENTEKNNRIIPSA